MPSYATLSYCWGRVPFLMLKSATKHQLYSGVALEDLPVAFRNAITITRQLNLDFIWIDALCIVQDPSNTEDWLAELSLMKDIYSGGYVNIAFTSATSVHEDCLKRSSPHIGGFVARLTLGDRCMLQSFHPTGAYEEATTEEHLATRAWTFQERLLARRTLYFGKTGVFWECRTRIASEHLPHGYPGIVYSKLIRPQHEPWLWHEIVSIYSRAAMTKASDKLPALSGIARAQHDLTGDRYLAGMWSTNLIIQLAWLCQSRRPKPHWRAPSWSWTSVDGQIDYIDPQGDLEVKDELVGVLSAHVTPEDDRSYTSIERGTVHLKYKALIAGTIVDQSTESDSWDGGKVTIDNNDGDYLVCLDCQDDERIATGSRIYMMPLFFGEHTAEVSARQGADFEARQTAQLVRGLILLPTHVEPDEYLRVGGFDFRSVVSIYEDHPRTSEFYHSIMACLEAPGSTTRADGGRDDIDSQQDWRCISII